jgi:DNA invertase Pin-like site-specific DNA recombinase
MKGDNLHGEGDESRSAPIRPAAATFGLGSTSKIRDVHVNRLALVYVRQSTPQQVLENRESRERQYALAEFAQRLGWPAERVVVIDEDQGQSGKTAAERSGFQRLMTEASLNHVGVVLGLELSRLSRSNKDWHQLIDVCGIFNTLLCDQDAVYDPLDSNDRLLLGMRGAMSEYELVTLRNRLLRGSRNKAERGELFLHVPVGYLKLSSEEIVQEPDEQARDMVQLVFDKFEELGSGSAVFRYFAENHLQLGFRPQRAGRSSELQWRLPSVKRILWMLRHPIYAGAYAYGLHRPGTKNPATGRTEGGKWFVPPEELPVLLRDRLPAYISWERYLANLERLKQNRARCDSPGTPKCGAALLQGLVVCSKCGYRMVTRYKGHQQPSYYYHRYWRSGGVLEDCGRITASVLDDLVVKELLRALEPASLELSLRAIENIEEERQRLHNHWRQKLERVQHEVSRAERQYHAVEPDNRLVARTLEARWEEALKKQRQLEEEYHRFVAKLPTTLSATDRERIQALAQNVPSLWNAAETTAADRKRIVRCLVERVVVVIDKASERNDVTIVWKGGQTTQHQLARPVSRFEHLKDYQRLIERLQELHREGRHRSAIATQLNAEGFVPPHRGVFTEFVISALMQRLGLVGELFRDDLLQKHERWISDLARELGVIPQTIHYWIKQGWIHSRRTPSGKYLMVWADKDEMRRLKQLARVKPVRIRARHPDLIIPKRRTAR